MLAVYIQQLETDGYCRIPQLFTLAEVDQNLLLAREWYERGKNSTADNVPFLNRDHPMVYNLQNKDIYFLKTLFSRSIIQEILVHFLNDQWYRQIPAGEPNYILRSYLARSSNEQLPMHIDSFVPYMGDYVFAMQVAIILEDQDESNGCTVLIPGSHQSGQYAGQDQFQNATPIFSQAGDVVIWDSRIWHGTLANKSERTRWAMIATFVRWWIKQAFQIPANVPDHIYAELTDSQRAVLGYCSVPFNDETEGIDMKQGYEALAMAGDLQAG